MSTGPYVAVLGCCIPGHDCAHDCEADRCNQPFEEFEVWSGGYGGLGAGLTYDENPYGHHHPDVRFNVWTRGWHTARFVAGLCRYCDSKRLHTMTVCQEHRDDDEATANAGGERDA